MRCLSIYEIKNKERTAERKSRKENCRECEKKIHSKLNFACINYAAEQRVPREGAGKGVGEKGAFRKRGVAQRGGHIRYTTRATLMFALCKETP